MIAKNIAESFAKLEELCSPRVISSVEDCYVKIAKVKGELPWHTHEDEDELFIIHSGSLVLEFEDRQIKMDPGDFYLVEKGKKHRPVAENICEVILIEKKTTAHTGNDDTDITRSIDEQLRPL